MALRNPVQYHNTALKAAYEASVTLRRLKGIVLQALTMIQRSFSSSSLA